MSVAGAGPSVEAIQQVEKAPASTDEPEAESQSGQRSSHGPAPAKAASSRKSPGAAGSSASVVWPIAVAAFAMAAPLGTFVLASEWGDVSQVLAGHAATALSTTYLMRAGALCLVLTLAAAAVYVKLRGAKLASRKAAFVWSGCALTFAMAVRLLFNKYEWLALGEGPDKFFFGGLPVGLALAAAAGVLRRRR